jgi:hypothetical protein
MKTKTCIKCSTEQTLDNFQLRKNTGKYRNQCKRCRQDKVNTYRRTNEAYKKRYSQYRKNKRETDPNYLMKDRLRARVRKVLKAKNTKKYFKTMELLGCDINTFKKHIESNFRDDMSWEKRNFVLDHILHCASFDLTDVEQQKKCFHYTNFQPLTWDENSMKSNKLFYVFEWDTNN